MGCPNRRGDKFHHISFHCFRSWLSPFQSNSFGVGFHSVSPTNALTKGPWYSWQYSACLGSTFQFLLLCFSVLYVLRPLFLFPTVWKTPYTSVIFSDSPLRLPTCHPPSFFLQTEAQARFSSPQRAWNQTVNCWSYPCHADGWECVSPTKFMEDLEHVRWKLLRQEKMIFAKAGGYFRSQSVRVLAQCDVSLLTCLFASERRMPIVRIVENILQFKKNQIPSRELTYPTWGKGKSSSKCHFWGIC